MVELAPRWRAIACLLVFAALGACERSVVLGSDEAPDAAVVEEDALDFDGPLVHPPDALDAPEAAPPDVVPDLLPDVAPDLPRPTRSGPTVSIALGDRHACAIASDRLVWCWGANDHGQVGDGTTVARERPEPVVGLRDVTSLVAGAAHTCALVGARVWCWGRGTGGRLLRAGDADATRPFDTGVDALSLAAGAGFTCARRAGGVSCWGADDVGQLGGVAAGDFVALPRPATSVYAGGAFACAVLDDGAAWCWGGNREGQLGRGALSVLEAPGAVLGVTGVTGIAAGMRHACATTAAAVWCWGDRADGQLGDGDGSPNPTPSRIAAWSTGDPIVCGDAFTCSKGGNAVSCAGRNDRGQLGDGTTTARSTPVTTEGFPRTGFTVLAAGARHACVETSDTQTWCWGDGADGQLGNGVRAVSTTRVLVRW